MQLVTFRKVTGCILFADKSPARKLYCFTGRKVEMKKEVCYTKTNKKKRVNLELQIDFDEK